MKVLLISDQYDRVTESAIGGIFNRALKGRTSVDIVGFSRQAANCGRRPGLIIIPHRARRSGFFRQLASLVDPDSYDVVIVRNFFEVLAQAIRLPDRRFKLGCWESFPHSFRRYFQAQQTGVALWRKWIEYRWKARRERKLLACCDFYLPITKTYKEQFHPELDIPWMPLPMGVDFADLPASIARSSRTHKRFTYTGTIDDLRQVDIILAGFRDVPEFFELDIYTSSQNRTVEALRRIKDERIRFQAPLPRIDLFRQIADSDVGIGLRPDDALYRSSSPTKVLEYYALGIPALLNDLPEHRELFDQQTGLYCELDRKAITAKVNEILRMPDQQLIAMGDAGRQIVARERDYTVMAARLLEFLFTLDRK